MYFYLTLFTLFILGLAVGSFLNVLIYRLESKQKNLITEKHKNKRKDLFGRSFCPNCSHQIAWYDNIPVVSWLVLGGKCRSCKKEISVQYPLVELATGTAFVKLGWFFLIFDFGQARMTDDISTLSVIPAEAGIQSVTNGFNFLFWLFFTSALIIIFVYDLKHQIIPDEVIYAALVAGLVFVAFLGLVAGVDLNFALDHLLSGLLAGGFFYVLAAISNGKWMGGGDIKLAAFMGLILGWQGIVVALYAAFVLGAIVGAFTLIAGKKKLGSKIPFGPFLVAGTFIGLFLGEKIISFYGKMFL